MDGLFTVPFTENHSVEFFPFYLLPDSHFDNVLMCKLCL